VSLDPKKLEKVMELAGGGFQARCPACAESGQDRKGEHLRIFPDGRYGCAVHPGERYHRRRIFELAGQRERHRIQVFRFESSNPDIVKRGILARLADVLPDSLPPVLTPKSSGAKDATRDTPGGSEVERQSRTLRTPTLESDHALLDFPRTPRTGSLPVTRIVSGESGNRRVRDLRDIRSESPVRAVRPEGQALPYIMEDGTLVIPFSSPSEYHWWNGGKSALETRKEFT